MQEKILSAISFARTADVDHLVTGAAAEYLDRHLTEPYALLAVGGYGRGELFPHSDIDLVLLLGREPDSASLKEPLSHFLRALWDAALKASQSVRTVDECCRLHETNLHLSISLLDVRFICGSTELFESLSQRLPEFFRRYSAPLLRNLAELTIGRHNKFDNTVYHLEPNIKEGPGGIRDIHFVEWVAKLAPSKEPIQHAVREVARARDFLYRLRFFLHERQGRDNNLLSFELQDQAAAALAGEPIAPEAFMRSFYRHARHCFRASRKAIALIERTESGLVRQFFDRRDRLSTADFTVSHNQVFLRNPAATLSSVDSIVNLFAFVGRRGVPLSWDAQRRLCEHASELPITTVQPLSWRQWQTLLGEPHASLALHEMEETGVLAAALPQWKAIESLVVRDFYHRYTVDEHTLLAIGAIDNLVSDEGSDTRRFRQLAREEHQLPSLRMALLLHDIGKGTTPGDHVRGSLAEADRLVSELGIPEGEAHTIRFLISHHLDLSQVMNGRDLEDPATARFLSSQIGTHEDLRKLTLLTFADISAVNPSAMTPWRAEQLWRVYSVASEQLTRELASDRIQHTAGEIVASFARPELAHFLDGLPARYGRVHSQAEIEQHFRLDQLRQRDGLALDIKREPGTYALTLVAADQPGLFAAICGTLASFGLNIVKAEAASNASGAALDEFRFTDPMQTLELNPAEVERLRWTIECVVKGTIEVCDLLKRRRPAPRPASSQRPPTIYFDNSASDSSTLLQYTGSDRPGLLFDLASALTEAGCNIELVLVNTEGHRAIDVFYLTESGGKLAQALQDSLAAKLTTLG